MLTVCANHESIVDKEELDTILVTTNAFKFITHYTPPNYIVIIVHLVLSKFNKEIILLQPEICVDFK